MIVVQGCRSDSECQTFEACINGRCESPCSCGFNAVCDVVNHRAQCKCLPGYEGNPLSGCIPPLNPCEPNPCGINALCELDNGSPICYCPKGMTGNPFKNCSKFHYHLYARFNIDLLLKIIFFQFPKVMNVDQTHVDLIQAVE